MNEHDEYEAHTPRASEGTPSPATHAPSLRRVESHRWTAPLSTEARAQLHGEAIVVLREMCAKGAWTMSVPVRDADADMVISAVVRDAELLAAELESTRSALREAQEDSKRLDRIDLAMQECDNASWRAIGLPVGYSSLRAALDAAAGSTTP